MIRDIIKGYSKILAACAKILYLFAVCAAAGFIIIYPLWKFAAVFPEVYTGFVLCIIAALITAFAVFRIRSFINFPGADKKIRIRRLWIGAARIAVLILGLVSFVFAVLAGSRLAGFGILAAVAVIYGILAFGLGRNTEKSG